MKFDTKAFLKTKFEPRTEDVPVPDLAAFFTDLKDEEVPVWTVRGLGGVELGQCAEAAERNKNVAAVIEGLAGVTKKDKVAAIKKMIGVSDNVPQDIAKRIAHFVAGSVSPVVDNDFAVRFCGAFPVEFYQLTNKIMALTGKGHVPGKLQGSGKVTK